MQRRTLLRRLTGLSALALAGCTTGAENEGDRPATGDATRDRGSPSTPTDADGTTTPADPTTTGPGVEERTITTTNTRCLSEADEPGAAVTTGADEGQGLVRVSGTLRTSDPCHEATVAAASHDDATGWLTVDIGAEPTDGGCGSCVGAVDYEATVRTAAGVPDRVVLTHGGDPLRTVGGLRGGDDGNPSVDRWTFRPADVETDRRFGATVGFDPEADTVTIRGVIKGRNGCKTAVPGEVTTDPEADALSVNVVTRDRRDVGPNTGCTQALVGLGYELVVAFSDDPPSSASVSHDGRAITTAAYGSGSGSDSDSGSGTGGGGY